MAKHSIIKSVMFLSARKSTMKNIKIVIMMGGGEVGRIDKIIDAER